MNKNFLTYKIIKGDGYGKKIGIPTFNFEISDNIFNLTTGVYYALLKIENNQYPCLLYYGPKYLLNKKNLTLEAYILDDFQQKNITSVQIKIIKFIRRPIKFSQKEMYLKQIKADTENARIFIKNSQ